MRKTAPLEEVGPFASKGESRIGMTCEMQTGRLREMGARIREMRDIAGRTVEEMAIVAGVSPTDYSALEEGRLDPPFTVLHRCAVGLGVDVTALIEGRSAKLSGFIINRKGESTINFEFPLRVSAGKR